MITIIFESHGTTVDNASHISSGHGDAQLSPEGEENAKDLGKRYEEQNFDAIFCSDLQRSYKTAEIAFNDKFPIIKDKRLRECDYGDLTRHPSTEVEPEKINHVDKPFPNGESYTQAADRMKSFLKELLLNYDGKRVMIIGHRATQYGLEHWLNGKSLKDLISAKFIWQPGWEYKLNVI